MRRIAPHRTLVRGGMNICTGWQVDIPGCLHLPKVTLSDVAGLECRRNLAGQAGPNCALGFGDPSWPGTEQDRKVTAITAASGHESPDSTLLTPSNASSRPSRMA